MSYVCLASLILILARRLHFPVLISLKDCDGLTYYFYVYCKKYNQSGIVPRLSHPFFLSASVGTVPAECCRRGRLLLLCLTIVRDTLNYRVSRSINQSFLAQFAQLLSLLLLFCLHNLHNLALRLSSEPYRHAESDLVSTISRCQRFLMKASRILLNIPKKLCLMTEIDLRVIDHRFALWIRHIVLLLLTIMCIDHLYRVQSSLLNVWTII